MANFSRGAINDDIIDNKKVPAGCDLLINIFELQRDPEIWTNPDSFEPERFLDDKNPTCGYMPFGDGLHKCIGYQFATAEIALVASVLLRNYQFDVIEGDYYQERAVITLSPNPSLRLLVSRSCRKST